MSYSSSTKQYKGSPNSYFRQLPDLDYPSLRNDRNSVYDYIGFLKLFRLFKMLQACYMIKHDLRNFVYDYVR